MKDLFDKFDIAHFPHAIILEGEGGEKEAALHLATGLVCEDEGPPCGACKSCRLAQSATHPDIKIIGSSDGKAIKVQQVRELREEAFFTPLIADGRVFIIHDADTLNAHSQNALLKVLEEPPKSVTFIICCENSETLLETVRSRCVIYSLDSEKQYEKSEIAGDIMAAAAKGNRKAILLYLQAFQKNRAAVKELLGLLRMKTVDMLKEETSDWEAKKLITINDKLCELEEYLVLNPNLSLVFCKICDIVVRIEAMAKDSLLRSE